MLVNVNGINYVHVCEQAHWARSAGNIAIENVCIIITDPPQKNKTKKKQQLKTQKKLQN